MSPQLIQLKGNNLGDRVCCRHRKKSINLKDDLLNRRASHSKMKSEVKPIIQNKGEENMGRRK